MNGFAKFRTVNWGMIVLCFFLPFSRGCNGEVRYLNAEAMQDLQSFLIRGLPVLYPVLLFVGAWVLKRLDEKQRVKIARFMYMTLVMVASFFVFKFIDSSYHDILEPEMLAYTAILVLLWGLMMFGWKYAQDAQGLQVRMAFLLTAFSSWFFPLMVLFDKEWLFGAWCFVVSSTCIIASYLIEFLPFPQRQRIA
jgi:hypothetical protein